MSARTPRILTLPYLGLTPLTDHGEEALVPGVELGLKFRRVAACVAGQHFLVLRHHFVAMLLDVPDRGLNLPRVETKSARNHIAMPSLLVVVEDIVDSNPRAGDLRSSPPIDDLGFNHFSSP